MNSLAVSNIVGEQVSKNRWYRLSLIGRSFAIVALLLFFSYTSICFSLLMKHSTRDVYFETLGSFYTVLVNFGIIAMILFECKNNAFKEKLNLSLVVGFVLVTLIFGQAYVVKHQQISQFASPFHYEWIAVVFLVIFVGVLTRIKYLSILPHGNEVRNAIVID